MGANPKPADSVPRPDGTLVAVLAAVRSFAGIAFMLLAGCPVGGDDGADVDAAGDGDGSSGTSGLTVTWGISPAVPGPVSVDVEVDELRLQISSLRVIGDSAPAGDMRTTRAPVDLRWRRDEAPAAIELATAPSGLYSRFELGVGGSDEHLTIKGEALVGGMMRDFEIEDERQHAVSINLAHSLAPGQRATIPVNIDAAIILAAVPFDQLDDDDGTLVLPGDDPTRDAVWAAIDRAITVPATFIIDDR